MGHRGFKVSLLSGFPCPFLRSISLVFESLPVLCKECVGGLTWIKPVLSLGKVLLCCFHKGSKERRMWQEVPNPWIVQALAVELVIH